MSTIYLCSIPEFSQDYKNVGRFNSLSQQLIYITTPEEQAELDVEVLANAFNMNKADVNVRVIVVDELPSVFNIESAKTTKQAQYGTVLSCALSAARDDRT